MILYVTGGAGMVGNHIVTLCRTKGFVVIAPPRAEVDLLELDSLQQSIAEAKPDIIIHCAGRVGGIQANVSAPYDFCFINAIIGQNVVEAARRCGVNGLVNLGSSCMYPRGIDEPLTENMIFTGELEPTNEGYAIAKLYVAKLAAYASEQHDLNYRTLIPCNLYGPADSFDPVRAHMLPAAISKVHDAMVKGADTVEIWGSGEVRREFMFAEDLADFVLFCLDKLSLLPQMTNVGVGHDFTINEYYKTIAEVLGYQGSFTHNVDKPVGMKRKLVSTTVQESLGWRPRTDLVTGIKKTYEYFLAEWR